MLALSGSTIYINRNNNRTTYFMSTALDQIPTKESPYINRSSHLSETQINYLIAKLGQFDRPAHIKRDFESTFSRTLADTSLNEFQKRYSNQIKQVRDTWINSLADEAGSHKRVRVLKLWEMYCILEDGTKRFINSKADKDLRLHMKQMESLLGSLRVEMEGNTLNINYRNLSTQKDNDLIETARDVLNKVDPSLIEDADYDILGNEDDNK